MRPPSGSGAGFGVRPADPDDLAAIVEIEAGPQTGRFLGVTGRGFHGRALADPDQEQLVAECGGEVVGFVVLAGLRDGGGRVELRRIVVAHGHRGAGYGRLLFRAVVDRAYRRYGARQVWLDVKPDNSRAQALYASEGFVPAGTIADPTDPGGVLLLLEHTPGAPVPAGEQTSH